MNPAQEFEATMRSLTALPDGRQPTTREEWAAVKAALVRGLMGLAKRPRWFKEDVLLTFVPKDLALLGALNGLTPDDLRAAQAAPTLRAACPPASVAALRACARPDLIEAIAAVDGTADRAKLWRSSSDVLAERAQGLGLTPEKVKALAAIPPPPDLVAALRASGTPAATPPATSSAPANAIPEPPDLAASIKASRTGGRRR